MNDKTISRFDFFFKKLREDPLFAEAVYIVAGRDGEEILIKGAYLLSDNGYLEWKELQSPIKVPLGTANRRWSRLTEAARKDVER